MIRRTKRKVSRVALIACIAFALPSPVASALTLSESARVALVPDAGSLPTSGSVPGTPTDSFREFSFTDLSARDLGPNRLSGFDTVVLNQVATSALSPESERALSDFVTAGGKLIIHDADGTVGNDYSWLPVPIATGGSCPGCGLRAGTVTIVEDNTLVSPSPQSPSYVDPVALAADSDAVGDGNVIVDADPRWSADITATNGAGQAGAIHAYASDGGLIVYDGFDTDSLAPPPAGGIDWRAKLWYQELRQGIDPDGLPGGASLGPPPIRGGATYVAMGDSYSAGEGLGPYEASAPQCHRSEKEAYARLLPKRWSGSLVFVACTGATTSDVFSPQPGKRGRTKQPAQLALLRQASGPNTRLITFTLGGNDAGFATVLSHCALFGLHHCRKKDVSSVEQALARLSPPADKGSLPNKGSLLFVIRQVHAAAPRARIVIGNYPLVFRNAGQANCLAGRLFGVPVRYRREDVDWLNAAGAMLNNVIRRTVTDARTASIDIELADAAMRFVDHGVNCQNPGGPEDWIRPIARMGVGRDPGSMHPTAAGQEAYATAVEGVLPP